jgi:hypothetical protein
VNFAAATQDELTEYQGVPNAKNNKLWDDSFNDCENFQFDHDSFIANAKFKLASQRSPWKKRGRSRMELYQ